MASVREKIRLEDESQVDGKEKATITTTEIVACQLLKEAGTEEFKKLSRYLN
jgi:hypothetical protein